MPPDAYPRSEPPRWSRRAVLRAAPALLIGLWAGMACSAGPSTDAAGRLRSPSGDLLETPSAGEMPSFATARTQRVIDAYRYAVGNREALRYIPCYCGCGSTGHESNYDCYVYSVAKDGRVTYNAHGAS